MKITSSVSLLAIGAVLLAGTAQADKWSDQFPHIKNSGDIPGQCSYEAMSKKDYSGQKLTIADLEAFQIVVTRANEILDSFGR